MKKERFGLYCTPLLAATFAVSFLVALIIDSTFWDSPSRYNPWICIGISCVADIFIYLYSNLHRQQMMLRIVISFTVFLGVQAILALLPIYYTNCPNWVLLPIYFAFILYGLLDFFSLRKKPDASLLTLNYGHRAHGGVQ